MVKTPLRVFRADDELWHPFMAACKANGTTATAVLLDAVRAYIAADQA